MSIYLCYDVKGIQSFIFKIPKLKYIVGGSALIDRFDKETIPGLDVGPDCQIVFAAGGKGTFVCKNEAAADVLQKMIIREAHAIGLDIRFGRDSDFSNAATHADSLFPFVPELNNGRPCQVSGLYPVAGNGQEHPVVRKRIYNRNEKVFRRFEDMLLRSVRCGSLAPEQLEFFHNVDSEEEGGRDGAKALGNRNRWAVICMDGNDIGMQFRAKSESTGSSEELRAWIAEMSKALDTCSTGATVKAINAVIDEWVKAEGGDLAEKAVKNSSMLTLPVRPLVVGGDDIIVLCHCSYAMTFVKEAMNEFARVSATYGTKMWPATGGSLSISAGILFTPVSLPLHSAIPFAESLLASAKFKGRQAGEKLSDCPTPACLDWEQITSSIVDTPAAKRQRELMFIDEGLVELSEHNTSTTVVLTRRPYTLDGFVELNNLARSYAKIPRSVRHRVLPALSKGVAKRMAFAAEISKNNPELARDIAEWNMGKSRWLCDGEFRYTDVIDALLLLEEDARMEKETAHHGRN